MSDGMTEANREMWRAEAENKLLAALADHVEAPSDGTWQRLVALAAECDSIRGGNFSGQTNWSEDIGGMIGPLLERDATAWAKLLGGMLAAEPYGLRHGTGERLKGLSPFAGKVLVTVRETPGGVATGGETGDVLGLVLKVARHVPITGKHALAVIDPSGFVPAPVPASDPVPPPAGEVVKADA